jgi:hypothetical protein
MKFQFGGLPKSLSKPDLDESAVRSRGYFRKAKVRRQRGNMIAFIAAVTLGLVLAILFFALKYTRMLGSNQEQRTAIEGSALQVANDISRIVYEDPNFGIIALSDFAPIGANTLAADGQPTPVRGINTVLATVRLDMIIADAVGSQQMKALAQADYQNAVKANNNLQSAIQDACSLSPQQQHLDWDGNPVNVYQDALLAYNQNIIRMSGSQSALDPSSLKITLGILSKGAATNTAVPQPSNYSNVTSSQTAVETINNQQTTCYKSYTNVPYDSDPFVFCGVDNSLKLVDISQFSTQTTSLPFSLTSVVKVEGDQVYQPDSNSPATRVHSVACAQPASAGDPRPFPGAMVIGFPNGVPPEIKAPITIFNDPFLSKLPVQISTSPTGDNGNTPTIPISTGGPYLTLGGTVGVGGYHFVKRAGTKPNVAAVVNMFNQPFSAISGGGGTAGISPPSAGQMFVYTFDSAGTPQPLVQSELPTRQILSSNHQITAKSKVTFTSSNGTTYGAVMSDVVAIPGSIYGGTHAGEPLLGSGQSNNWNGGQSMTMVGGLIGGLIAPLVMGVMALLAALLGLVATVTNLLIGIPPAGSGFTPASVRPPNVVRPTTSTAARVARDTYTQNGLAVDMEFPKAPPSALNSW